MVSQSINMPVERRLNEGEDWLVTYALASNEVNKQNKKMVKRALQKVKDGTYGFCDLCGKEIIYAELWARPHACICHGCERLS